MPETLEQSPEITTLPQKEAVEEIARLEAQLDLPRAPESEVPADYSSQDMASVQTRGPGILTKIGNSLLGTRLGRTATVALTAASIATAYSLATPDKVQAETVCTTSPGGDSTVCTTDPPADTPPSDGGDQNPGNGNGGHNGGNHGNGHHGQHQPPEHGLSKYYENPLRDVRNLVPWRIDMGVDYHGHGRVYAIGTGVVTLATKHSSFWADEDGNAVVYHLSEGPAKGLNVFVAEGCTPKVHIGEKITSDTVVCRMYGDSSYPGIEMGWAMLRPHGMYKKDYPAAYPVYDEGDKTAYGAYFSRFITKLGAPAGNSNPAHVSSTSYMVGSVPHRYRRLPKLPLR